MKTKTIVYMLVYLIIIVPLPQLVSAQALADSQQQAKAKVECDKAREFWQQQNFEKAMVHFKHLDNMRIISVGAVFYF
jgi:hypothetical protein